MRGKPLAMDGSQLDVVEKRRLVPDLSGLDPEFRPMIEAMLQPDPANRPASMAEIADMTRDETIVYGAAAFAAATQCGAGSRKDRAVLRWPGPQRHRFGQFAGAAAHRHV